MMAKAGFTTLPCPGCGERNERKKDSVCPKCHEFIETGKKFREDYLKKANDETYIETLIPTEWEYVKYSAIRVNQHSEIYRNLGEKMKELVDLLSIKKGRKPTYGYMSYLENRLVFEDIYKYTGNQRAIFISEKQYKNRYQFNADAILPKSVFEKLEEINELITKAISETQDKGIEYGRNLLFQLNNGHISMDDFEKPSGK